MPNIQPYVQVHQNVRFGAYVTVWSFSTIGAFVELGDHVVIGSNCYIGYKSVIGEGSRIQHGVFLPNRSKIGRNVFIGPNATFTDDKFPRVRNAQASLPYIPSYLAEPPTIHDGASIGAGAVVLPGITIGEGAMIAAGAVVTRDVPANITVKGIPAREAA